MQSAHAALNLAKANDACYTLTAPFDGIVGAKNISVGGIVVPGAPLPAFTLGDVSKLRLETTNLAEVDVPKIKVGQSAQVTLDAFPGKTFSGKVFRRRRPKIAATRFSRYGSIWTKAWRAACAGA